jgi:hypothetical protein
MDNPAPIPCVMALAISSRFEKKRLLIFVPCLNSWDNGQKVHLVYAFSIAGSGPKPYFYH